jgi:hypothetical protein
MFGKNDSKSASDLSSGLNWLGRRRTIQGNFKPVSPFLKGGKGDFLELGIWILFVICLLVLGA